MDNNSFINYWHHYNIYLVNSCMDYYIDNMTFNILISFNFSVTYKFN